MARLNYYRFPEGVDENTRAEHGCDKTSGCALNGDLNLESAGWKCERGWCCDCEHICVKEVGDTLSGISVSRAKQLLREFSGSAWTYHIDRDGGVFETTEIKLKGNNSRHRYNRHL